MAVTNRLVASEATEPAEPLADELRELLVEGQQQGHLTDERISEALADLELAPDELENILAALTDEGIEIVEGDSPDEGSASRSEEEAAPALDLSIRAQAATRCAST